MQIYGIKTFIHSGRDNPSARSHPANSDPVQAPFLADKLYFSGDRQRSFKMSRYQAIPACLANTRAEVKKAVTDDDKLDLAIETIDNLLPFLADEIQNVKKSGNEPLHRCLREMAHSLGNHLNPIYMEKGKQTNRKPDIPGQLDNWLGRAIEDSQAWVDMLSGRKTSGEVIQTALELFRQDTTYRGLQYEYSIPDDGVADMPAITNLDLFSMLYHPLINACKYTPCGAVEVKIKNAIRLQDGQRYLSIGVHDTGLGMPEDLMKLVNDPDTEYPRGLRGDNVKEVPGTGFGMPELKQLVQRYGGILKVGKGDGGPGNLTQHPVAVGWRYRSNCRPVR